MKRRMQKLLSICLSAAMIGTMTVPTFAAPVEDMQLVTETGEVEDALTDAPVVEEQSGEAVVETRDSAVEELAGESVSFETVMNAILASYKDTTNPWAILEMVKAGKKADLTTVDAYTKEAINTINTSTSATDIEKAMIVLSALGQDVTALDVDGTKINAVSKLTGTDLTTINAVVFGLSAMDSGKYYFPKDSKVTRETLITSLLGMKLSDGGWSFNGTQADPDMTAMAITSLAPYYNAADAVAAGISEDLYKQVKTVVDGAVERLSAIQNDDGTYTSTDTKNANSSAMVMMALSSVGVDSVKDARFVKNGKSVMDGLMTFALADNSGLGFSDNKTLNALATEQGLRGMVSYSQFAASGKAYNLYESGALDQIEVSMSVIGDTIHGEEAHTEYVTWIGDVTKEYAPTATVTVMDMLETVLKENGYEAVVSNGYISGIKTPEGVTLGSGANGSWSGWMYSVNGESPSVGMSAYNLQYGDAVKVYFEDNYPVTGITMNKTTQTAYVGGSTQLNAAVAPLNASNPTLEWKSSDESIASVTNSGLVKGKKAGTVTITASATDWSGVSATCTITVKKPSIKLNYSTLSLQKGKSTTAIKIKSAAPSTEKIKSAKSSKASVATVKVSKGVLTVTGKKVGTVVITVTSTNGATATVKITVKSAVNVSKLTLNKTTATMKKGGKLTLKVTKTPVTATNKITWTSSNKSVATVSSTGVVTAKKKGTATITVKSANGKKATCKITVK